MMNKAEKRSKIVLFAAMIAYFTVGYLAINWVTSHRSQYFDISFLFENDIPFIPVFIFGYILVYAGIAAVFFVIDDPSDWRRTAISYFIATTICYMIFLILPVKMTMRPDLSVATGLSSYITRYYYVIDLPYNCFPSLHVTYPTLAVLISWRNHSIWRWIFMAIAIIVAMSVVLVKQHYVADVMAGVACATLSFILARRIERRPLERGLQKMPRC